MGSDETKSKPDASTFRQAFSKLIPYALRYRWRLISIVLLSATVAGLQSLLLAFSHPLQVLLFPTDPNLKEKADKIHESIPLPWLNDFVSNMRHGLQEFAFGGDVAAVADADRTSVLIRLTLIIVCIAIVAAGLQYIYILLSRNLGLRMITDLRRDVCAHLLKLSMRYHGKKKMGDLLTRLTTDVNSSLRSITVFFEEVLQTPFMVIGSLFVAFYCNPYLTGALLILIPVVAFPVAFFARKVRKGSYRSSTASGVTTTTMEQMLSGIRVVKAFQMEDKEIENLDEANRSFIRTTMKMIRAKAATEGFMILLTVGGTALMFLGIGLFEFNFHSFHGQSALALTFMGAIAAMYAQIKQSTRLWFTLLESSGASLRLFELIDIAPEVVTAKDAVPVNGVHKSIEFRNLNFFYDPNEPVLHNLQFKAKSGERIAIVGPSGAGKSTLLDLVARFYDPVSGAVLIDGVDLKTIQLDSWLKQLAIVSQQPFLFNTSIRENIRYGRPTATDAEVESAAKAANVHEFVRTLPEGYDTVVGERGTRLSGGQLQRITIARAILKGASVLLLDEATSSLDSESEKAVQLALDNLMKGKTTFVIAHRLSTVRNADRILVLDQGRMIEHGNHSELMDKGGVYKRLYDLQFAGT